MLSAKCGTVHGLVLEASIVLGGSAALGLHANLCRVASVVFALGLHAQAVAVFPVLAVAVHRLNKNGVAGGQAKVEVGRQILAKAAHVVLANFVVKDVGVVDVFEVPLKLGVVRTKYVVLARGTEH